MREANRVEEKILRRHSDRLLDLASPQNIARGAYPWESTETENLSLITKEFFRCKGSSDHESYVVGDKERLFDCTGSERHSLPLKEDQEYVYPILIELLNYVQNTLGKKVIITCGHRCPQHNRYSDPSESNRSSKHMIGAEVDFYVEGFEKKPEIIVDLLKQFYLHDDEVSENLEYTTFKRYLKSDSHVSTPPWYNHEVYIKINKENEGRDLDNSHPYPYITLMVRHDRKSKERVTYTWKQAFYSYLRY